MNRIVDAGGKGLTEREAKGRGVDLAIENNSSVMRASCLTVATQDGSDLQNPSATASRTMQ